MTSTSGPDTAATTRERILRAAELLFAEHGYDGASLRDIALEAQTRIGLISYHFQSKEALFEAIIERRSSTIGKLRLDFLTKERKTYANGPIPAARLIYAYTWPFLDLARNSDSGWKSYTRLISMMSNSRKWAALVSSNYDPVASVFLNEFHRALPDLSPDRLAMGFTFMISIMLGVAAETGRVDTLSSGDVTATEIERIFGAMLPFVAGGFEAMGGVAPEAART